MYQVYTHIHNGSKSVIARKPTPGSSLVSIRTFLRPRAPNVSDRLGGIHAVASRERGAIPDSAQSIAAQVARRVGQTGSPNGSINRSYRTGPSTDRSAHLHTSVMRPGEQRQAIRSKRKRRNCVLVPTEGLNDGVGSAVPHVDQAISSPRHQVTPVAAGCEGEHLQTNKCKQIQKKKLTPTV